MCVCLGVHTLPSTSFTQLSIHPSPTKQNQEIASYAFKVDDAVNGGDKAQKAFKPGYDVTTDPYYQARRLRILLYLCLSEYMSKCRYPPPPPRSSLTPSTQPTQQQQEGVEVPPLRDDYEICKRFDGADPSLEVSTHGGACIAWCTIHMGELGGHAHRSVIIISH